MLKNFVMKNRFYDSVLLMQIASEIKSEFGFEKVSVLMGTQPNKDLMSETGVLDSEGSEAGANDVVVAFVSDDSAGFDGAYQRVIAMLETRESVSASTAEQSFYRIASAAEHMKDANLVFLSLPGPYVRYEAQKALNLGLNVMIFSDNVSLEDELALKETAHAKGLLVMGPDCGTCIINGKALGFANVVPSGNIGIVGASGTGIQELTALLARAGLGISHAIGTGGRDLSEKIGGITMLDSLQALAQDDATQAIIILSKPPAGAVAERIVQAAARSDKPVVVCFVQAGAKKDDFANISFVSTIEDAVAKMCAIVNKSDGKPSAFEQPAESVKEEAKKAFTLLSGGQKYIRGLYSGGTLCEEALVVLHHLLGKVWSNTSVYTDAVLSSGRESKEHTLVDMGDDEFTRGMPHPMIDYTLRKERLSQECRDPQTALILLDIVLGYGSHSNPGGEIAEILMRERALARQQKRDFVVCAYLCGTPDDPQGYDKQKKILEDAGVILFPSNAQAARFAALVVSNGQVFDKL